MEEVHRMKLIEYTSRNALMTQTAAALATALRAALDSRETVSFAVPGGTTPGPVFDALAQVALDWSRVHVLLTDERWVPESDPQSNAALVRSRLLTGHAAAAQFTPYYTDRADSGAAADRLSGLLAPLLPLDVLLLGMGADMHTASLFPNAIGLQQAMAADAQMLMPITVPGQQTTRFTLTAPALSSARATHILITGNDKRAALAQAQTLSALEAPVQTVLQNATIHWSAE